MFLFLLLVALAIPARAQAPAFTSGQFFPFGHVGFPYSFTLSVTGAPPIAFAIRSGTLPAGLALNAQTGTVSGTPSVVVTTPVTFSATNAQGTAAAAYYIYIYPPGLSQTINFAPLPTRQLGSGPFLLTASSSTLLPVTFQSRTLAVCSNTGGTVFLLSVGTCTIRASQGGNSTYNPAPDVDQSFSVTAPGTPADVVFAPLATLAVGSFPYSIAVGDFNRDGKPDLAIANESAGTVSVLLGNGDATFTLGSTLRAGAFPAHLAVGDLDGDGKLDIAVANQTSKNVMVYLGNGDGTFRSSASYDIGSPAYALVIADLDNDGKPDLIVTDVGGGPTDQTLQVLLGNGDGTFRAPVSYTTGLSPRAVIAADVNRDGKLDLVTANNSSNNVSLLLGSGDGTFQGAANLAVGTNPVDVATADFNNDGNVDLVVANSSANSLSVLLGRGDGTFVPGSTLPTGSTPFGIAVADFNGDGQPDIAVSNQFGPSVSVFLGKGDGSFQAPLLFSLPNSPGPIVAADLNADGSVDLVVGNISSSSITVLKNQTSMPASLLATAGTPQTAPVNAAYSTALSAAVRDASDKPLTNRVVTFVAPSTGPSGSFAGGAQGVRVVTDAFGVAQAPAFAANSIAGPFSVLASVGSLVTPFALSNAPGANQAPQFTSGAAPAGVVNVAYSFTLTASGFPPPTFSVTPGSLPPGLVLDATSGAINGTPTAPGTYSGTATASNGVLPDATKLISIAVASATQTISFGALATRTMGNPPFAVSATASSGLPVSFSTRTPVTCSVSGSTVALLAAGACTIRASQAGNAVYLPAPDVDQSFNVAQASQTISFGPLASRPLGTPPFAAAATASSGLRVTISPLTPSVCTISGGTVTLVAMGTCTLRASQAGDATYAPAPSVDLSFSVTAPAGQTIAFESPISQRAATVVILTATASSGLAVSFASLTPAVCGVTGATVTLTAVGTCTIRASQAGSAIYPPAPDVDRSFSVVSAVQSISFQPMSNIGLNASWIELIASASSGLPVSFASLTPAVCHVNDNWAILQSAGTCTIRASQAGNANYGAAANVDQSVTAMPASQTLLFPQPATQSLLRPRLQLSATASSGLPVTFSSVTPGVCTVSGSVATFVAAGTCTIRATQEGNASFQAALFADRSFTVAGESLPLPTATAPLPGPFIEYSTRLGGYSVGGVAHDTGFDMAVASDGSAWVAGSVASTAFPGLSSARYTNGGLGLIYVARMNPRRGLLDVATIVGGPVGQEQMAIDAAGNVYIAAFQTSTTYPLTGGTYTPSGSMAIFRVGPDGSIRPLAAAVDPAVQTVRAIAVDAAGGVYFTGAAGPGLVTSVNAAVPAASVPAGGPYLIKLAPGGDAVAYATYLTVSGSRPSIAPDSLFQSPIDNKTTAYALAVDSAGNAYLAGQARAGDFPVTPGAPDTGDDQYRDAFVAKVNSTGGALMWVARLGGNDAERATSIALAPDGSVVIGGKTATRPFLGTANAFQSEVEFTGENGYEVETGFVAKLAADGGRWIFVAPIGAGVGNLVRNANEDPKPVKVTVDASGAIYAAGRADHRVPVGAMDELGDLRPIQSPAYYDDGTAALDYGSDAYFRTRGGFLMKIAPDGSRLVYSVIVNAGTVTGLALDQFGAAYVAGYNAGPPQVDAAQADPGPVFVAKVIGQPMPLLLTAAPNPATVAQSVVLTATLGDARYDGSVEFRDGARLLGTVPLANGTATFATALDVGIHRLSAVFRGGGPFADAAAPEVVQVVDQVAP